MSEQDELQKLDWVAIPNASFMMKYVFDDTGYNVMISNLTFLYSEKLSGTNILERFRKFNPFAQMKLRVILDNLEKVLQKSLTENTELDIKLNTDKLIMTLQFPAAHVLCSYDIEMDLLEANKVTRYIIGPTILTALLSQKKILELQKQILSVDSSSSTLSSSSSKLLAQNAIDPGWLKGENVSTETLLDSFLKLQCFSKTLCDENREAYFVLKNDQLKNESSVQPLIKKTKLHENCDNKSLNIQFDDSDERISAKEEGTSYSDAASQSVKNTVKKPKTFKI